MERYFYRSVYDERTIKTICNSAANKKIMQVRINEAYELFENKVYGVIKVSVKC